MGAKDISLWGLAGALLLLSIPFMISVRYRLQLGREMAVAVCRMGIQLVVAGLLLTLLFKMDHIALTFLWFLLMLAVAARHTLASSHLKQRQFFWPVFLSFFGSTLLIVMYFNGVIVQGIPVFSAKFMIVISGMLMGNSLRNTIVAVSSFYKALAQDKTRLEFEIGNGASLDQTLAPLFRESLLLAFKPTLATMATMGIIALPGMMTGQILGGSPPLVAIKYQIAIMIAIFVATVLGVTLSLRWTAKVMIDHRGQLKQDSSDRLAT